MRTMRLTDGPARNATAAALRCAVYLPDEPTLLARAADPASSIRQEWAQSCHLMHAGWQQVFWGWNESVQLVGEVGAGRHTHSCCG